MNPPGATDVLSINGLGGSAFSSAEAAAVGLPGPPALSCGRWWHQTRGKHARDQRIWQWPSVPEGLPCGTRSLPTARAYQFMTQAQYPQQKAR